MKNHKLCLKKIIYSLIFLFYLLICFKNYIIPLWSLAFNFFSGINYLNYRRTPTIDFFWKFKYCRLNEIVSASSDLLWIWLPDSLSTSALKYIFCVPEMRFYLSYCIYVILFWVPVNRCQTSTAYLCSLSNKTLIYGREVLWKRIVKVTNMWQTWL